jgi:hypothetical protein
MVVRLVVVVMVVRLVVVVMVVRLVVVVMVVRLVVVVMVVRLVVVMVRGGVGVRGKSGCGTVAGCVVDVVVVVGGRDIDGDDGGEWRK